jgi:hypothetical protein
MAALHRQAELVACMDAVRRNGRRAAFALSTIGHAPSRSADRAGELAKELYAVVGLLSAVEQSVLANSVFFSPSRVDVLLSSLNSCLEICNGIETSCEEVDQSTRQVLPCDIVHDLPRTDGLSLHGLEAAWIGVASCTRLLMAVTTGVRIRELDTRLPKS